MGGIYLLSGILVIIIMMKLKRRKDLEGYDSYIIKKGKHFSLRNQSFIPYKISLAPRLLRFDVVFLAGCDYEEVSEDDIHKLYGVNYGFDHHYRSVRIGWRYHRVYKMIELFTYAYVKGKRVMKHLMLVKQYEDVSISMYHSHRNEVQIQVDQGEKKALETIKGIDQAGIRFKLFPYFGGNIVAPNDIKILIKQH